MRGLKRHTHQDREAIIKEMIPLINRKFGDNLLALAAQASYARNEDLAYSDLELIAFVREMPKDKKMEGMSKIRNGLLVELIWTTKETYLKETRDVTENWYIAGSDTLLPIINEEFINNLKRFEVINLTNKCLHHAANHWREVQEATAKVLNAVINRNRIGISLLIFDMYLQMLIILAFLNLTPYTTFSQFIPQSKMFKNTPPTFEELTHIVITGSYQNLIHLEKTVVNVFTEFEEIFEALGFELYDDNVDPNRPMKKFV